MIPKDYLHHIHLYSSFHIYTYYIYIYIYLLTSFDSLVPIAFEENVVLFTVEILLMILPNLEKPFIFSASPLPIIKGISKLIMLYPVTISGSAHTKNSTHLVKSSSSVLHSITFVPSIEEQLLRVKTFLRIGCSSPCIWMVLAIVIIGLISQVGNFPSFVHSISKDSIRNGAMFEYSSDSVVCAIISFGLYIYIYIYQRYK